MKFSDENHSVRYPSYGLVFDFVLNIYLLNVDFYLHLYFVPSNSFLNPITFNIYSGQYKYKRNFMN